MKDVLRALDFGNSVAEFDESLEKYFVENEAYEKLVTNKIDIVAGDKGTGKTALYRILQKRFPTTPELKGIEVLAGFNPTGMPIFQRLVRENTLTEGQYSSVWKAYVMALGGNWALDIAGEDYSPSFKRLSVMLTETGLLSKDEQPATIFSKIVNAVQRAFLPKSAELEFTFSETGIPIVTPKLSFGSRDDEKVVKEIAHEDALKLLDECLSQLGYSLWIVLDRLDEAFQGFPLVEVPALRALFRTYLDLLEFKNFRLKLFVRRDLMRRIIGDGFVNLTHLNARKVEISWDEKDLLNLLCRRIRDNAAVMSVLNGPNAPPDPKVSKDPKEAKEAKEAQVPMSDDDLFYRLFPRKVDQANRKPTSWNWMMARIRDGNDVRPPRNLIDLVMMAKAEQLKVEAREPRIYEDGVPLIGTESIRKALEKLSTQRVEDTLLAEASPHIATMVQRFRRSRSEHNSESLQKLLGLPEEDLAPAVYQLVQIGFLEELKSSWKVPMLYRDGLEITQGKAFQATDGEGAAEDTEE